MVSKACESYQFFVERKPDENYQNACPDWNSWIRDFILDQCRITFDFKSITSNAARAS